MKNSKLRPLSAIKQWIVPKGNKVRKILGGASRAIRMDLDLTYQTQIYLGLYERELHPWIKRFSKNVHTIVDIGASHGVYTLYFLEKSRAEKVVSFEPDENCMQMLRRNIELNPSRDPRRLELSAKSVERSEGPNRTTLDAVLGAGCEPCLIKMDVEGAEFEILEGSSRVLSRPDARWIVETHSSDLERQCVDCFHKHGFFTKIIHPASWRVLLPELRHGQHNRWLVAVRDERLLDTSVRFQPQKKILYVQYTNPAAYPPIEHSSRILADAGWKVLFLGAEAKKVENLRMPEHPHIVTKKLPYCPAGLLQKINYFYFVCWVTAYALIWRPRWIYASDYFSALPALLIRMISKIQTIYHEHDAEVTNAMSFFMRFCLWARKTLAKKATLCILPNKERLHRFVENFGISREKTFCVWNCPRITEVRPPRSDKPGDHLRLMYHGSIVPERLPLPIIRALSLMPKKVHLTVLGYESAWQEGYVNELRRYAASLGVADQLKIVEPLPRSEMMIHGQACDVGICLMPLASQDVNFRYMTGASNKPFDYLACGMALLTSDLADWKKMYVESGYGLACDPGNPESIAAELRWFFDHPAETRAMGERGRQRILSEWNYNNQFMPVMQKLTQEGHAK